MSAPFDPYHKWLGIAADEQPASLYRLLGVRPFESDPDVIDTAADQRMRLLKSFQGGKHGALSQKLLNEISRARQRLLDPKERADYDALLKEQMKRQAASGSGSSSGDSVSRMPRWPEGKVPATIEEFYQVVAASGILTFNEVQRLHDGFPPERRPNDMKGLATELVRAGKLTKYQAINLIQGRLKYLLFGEYLVQEKLGQGGMGQVLKAQHRRMKRMVALKLMSSEALKNPDAVRRFEREVQAAARLIHPNIVTAFDANEHEGMHFFVMEFVDGIDLGALSKTHGPLPVKMALDYTLQAARGLAYAHGRGVVHRDIKPGNLLVDKDGTVKILDMGLARLDLGKEDHELTGSGQVLGTVDYMAPEQALDTRTADARADIYSLGCTLYRLLTGEAIYTGESIMQKLLLHREAPIPSMNLKRPDVPAAVEAVWKKMVAKAPDHRYQTMAEVVTALERCTGGQAATQPAEEEDKPIDSVTYKLNEFLEVMARENANKSIAGKSAGSFSAVRAAVEAKKAAAPASEVTKNLTGAETDPNTHVTLQSQRAPLPVHSPPAGPAQQQPESRTLLYIAIACVVAALLVLAVGAVVVATR
jgi:serine/threonine protein kinase